jgi:hypothetical protein
MRHAAASLFELIEGQQGLLARFFGPDPFEETPQGTFWMEL